MERIFACPGQVRLAAQMPDVPTIYSLRGDHAHAILSECIRHNLDADIFVGDKAETSLGTIVFEESDADAVQVAIDYVRERRAIGFDEFQIEVEADHGWPVFTRGSSDIGGSVDVAIMFRRSEYLEIIDYKHGVGNYVDCEDNKQLLTYLVCVMNSLRLFSMRIGGGWSYRITVIQPNYPSGPSIRRSAITYARVQKFLGEVENAILAAEAPDAPLVPGSHCDLCRAAPVCPAVERKAISIIGAPASLSGARFSGPAPQDLGVERCAAIHAQADFVKDWLKSIDNYLFGLATSGVKIPGHKLVEAQRRRKWSGEPADIAGRLQHLSGGRLSPKDVLKLDLLPLTDVEKKLVAAYRDAVPPDQKNAASEQARQAMAFLTTKDTSGNLSLVPEDDKRPAIARGAREDFEGVVV